MGDYFPGISPASAPIVILNYGGMDLFSPIFPAVQILFIFAAFVAQAAGLRWSQIDLTRRSLTLYITKTEPRTVPLTNSVVKALQEINKMKGDNDFVFLNEEGKSEQARNIPSSRFRTAFNKARARAELPELHMHDLRHTAASHLLMAGTDIRTLAAILGHSTLQMVLRYTHLLDEHKLDAVDRINDFGMN